MRSSAHLFRSRLKELLEEFKWSVREMERQTEKDTTEGPGQPMGKRGAYAADTVAR